jgi:hypothetical protein
MRFRTTLLLLLVVAGLGAYVYWVEYPKSLEEAKKKTLFEFSPGDVTAVTLTYADREIALQREGDGWRLTKPSEMPADTTAANNLVNAIAECEVVKDVAEGSADLAQYGLDKPLVTIKVSLKDRALPTISVGKNTPVGFSTYVQRGDDKKIVLTSSAFRSGMDKQVKDLRDKTILSFADADVNQIELRGPDRLVRLSKTKDGWQIDEPGPFKADATAVRSLLSTLRAMRATDFPSDHPTDLAQFGLDTPQLVVTLRVGTNNTEQTLRLGKKTDKNELYVQTAAAPTVYTVSDWALRDLEKSANDLRDKTVLAFDRDAVTAVEVRRRGEEAFRLVRGADKKWRVEGSGGEPAEATLSTFVSDLHDLKGYTILADVPADLGEFGLNDPALRITVIGEGGTPLGTVLITERSLPDGKKDYPTMVEGGSTIYAIRDYVFTRLDKQRSQFIVEPTPTIGAGTPTAEHEAAEEPGEMGDLPEDEPME